MARSAYREAVTYFEQALTALRHLPEQRHTQELAIDLRYDLGSALKALGELGQRFPYLREAETLARGAQRPTAAGADMHRHDARVLDHGRL